MAQLIQTVGMTTICSLLAVASLIEHAQLRLVDSVRTAYLARLVGEGAVSSRALAAAICGTVARLS